MSKELNKAEISKKAAQILEANPERNHVYVSTSGQAFFNKTAAKNHESLRGEDVSAFFRSGFEPSTETKETLDEMQEALAERQSVIAQIKEVLEKDDHGIKVTPETDEVVAEVIKLKEDNTQLKLEIASLAKPKKQAVKQTKTN